MATLNELKKYLNYEFSSGSYTGKDYQIFQTKYINYIKNVCKQNNWEVVNIGRNHYCFTLFIKNQANKYIYLSISDVRYFTNEWYHHILIRTAKNEKDYKGCQNHYTGLETLDFSIERLFQL